MYKNYLLRNISPLDPEYDLSDLINDFYEMVKPKTRSNDHDVIMEYVLTSFCMNDEGDAPLDDASGTLSKEKLFRQVMYDEYIKLRSVALNTMKEGIRLRGEFQQYSNQTMCENFML